MILHADRYFEHDYDVKNDLVSIKWPTIESIYLPEIFHSISKLVENVKNYNIRNLLIDARTSELKATNDEANKVVILLTEGLATSRLEKIARVESGNILRENLLRQMAKEMNMRNPFTIRFFNKLEAARNWLEAEDN